MRGKIKKHHRVYHQSVPGYLQEKVKCQKDEKKADDGVTEAAPLQDNDRTVIIDNDDMWWRVLPSNFTGKDLGKTHVSTHSMIGGIGNERKGETHPLPQPYHRTYGIGSEENLMQGEQIDASLSRRQAGHFRAEPVAAGRPLCPGRWSGLSLPLPVTDQQPASIEDQCWMLPATIPRSSTDVFISICNMSIYGASCRLKISQNKESLTGNLWTSASPAEALNDCRCCKPVNSPLPQRPAHELEEQKKTTQKCCFKQGFLESHLKRAGGAQRAPRWRLPSHAKRTRAWPRSLPAASTLPAPRGERTVSSRAFQGCGLWSGIFFLWREAKGSLGVGTTKSRGCFRPPWLRCLGANDTARLVGIKAPWLRPLLLLLHRQRRLVFIFLKVEVKQNKEIPHLAFNKAPEKCQLKKQTNKPASVYNSVFPRPALFSSKEWAISLLDNIQSHIFNYISNQVQLTATNPLLN